MAKKYLYILGLSKSKVWRMYCTGNNKCGNKRNEDPIVVIKGLTKLWHACPLSEELCRAEIVMAGIKRKAEEHPPAQLVCNKLADVSPDVLVIWYRSIFSSKTTQLTSIGQIVRLKRYDF